LREKEQRKNLERKLAEAEERARVAEQEKEKERLEWEAVRKLEKLTHHVAAVPAPAQINISGIWASPDGQRYEFSHFGNKLRMVVRDLFGIVVLEGEGTILASRVNITYLMPTPMGWAQGRAEAQVSPDGHLIQGYWYDSLGQSGPVSLFR
jgi:hypothetical protein